MKWMVTEDKLGRDQVEVIDEIGNISDRPIWIKGHAGSGKSVLLLHSLADYLIRNPKANVCVVVFTHALIDLLTTGLQQIPKLRDRRIPVLTIYQLRDNIEKQLQKNLNTTKICFDAIFCDEVQDLPVDFIQSMKSSCRHLIIAGDAEQSIYTSIPRWEKSPATSNEIRDHIFPVEKNLSIIYRLTNSVLSILRKVFPSMLEDRPNLAKGDTEINLYVSDSNSIENEINFCWREIKQTNTFRTSEVSAILLSTHDAIVSFVNTVLQIEGKNQWERVDSPQERLPIYTLMNRHLRLNDIPLMYIGNGYGSLTEADKENKVVIMTYHSSKGLDFDYVYLPLVNEQMIINSTKVDSLLLVALSRSRSGLFISYTGTMHDDLEKFLTGIQPKKIQDITRDTQDPFSDEILF